MNVRRSVRVRTPNTELIRRRNILCKSFSPLLSKDQKSLKKSIINCHSILPNNNEISYDQANDVDEYQMINSHESNATNKNGNI